MRKNEVKIITRFLNYLLDILAFTFIVIITILLLKKYHPAFKEYSVQNNRIKT